MKKDKFIYYTTTGIIAAVMLFSAGFFAFSPQSNGAFTHLGLPHWFKMELTAAKILGVIALVIPAVPHKLKEFAYFGFAIVLLSTPIAHLSSGDSAWLEVGHSLFFITLVTSYVYYHKVRNRSLEIGVQHLGRKHWKADLL